MKNHLSVPSRILVAFASGALVAVFFLPAWRIDLFAPQYPEGLSMYIWINKLTGQIDIINGLNHYIGMKHISNEMFPEFKFIPYVVGFFMLLGMIVAITGKRKFLLYYLILTVIGCALVLLDFYKWGYNYGHHLDPTAPVQVPGLTYQPPLFGHKRLLNFDAYSFPDVGGIIVAGAALLAFGVWLVEWYRDHKTQKVITLNKASIAVSILIFLFSCSVKPQPLIIGKDICSNCKMTIMDPKFGAEIITKKGKVYKFDDMRCIVHFLKSGEVKEDEISKKLVINYDKQDDFINVQDAKFLQGPSFNSPMGSNVAGFISDEEIQKKMTDSTLKQISWEQLLALFK